MQPVPLLFHRRILKGAQVCREKAAQAERVLALAPRRVEGREGLGARDGDRAAMAGQLRPPSAVVRRGLAEVGGDFERADVRNGLRARKRHVERSKRGSCACACACAIAFAWGVVKEAERVVKKDAGRDWNGPRAVQGVRRNAEGEDGLGGLERVEDEAFYMETEERYDRGGL